MHPTDYSESNRRAWNATADQHRGQRWDIVLKQLTDPALSPFDQTELDLLQGLEIAGKDVIQLCCNNGREVLSLKKLGAGRCVGVDISDAFIAQARELADISGLEADFIRANVFELPPELDDSFDLVLVTIGAFVWLADLAQFMALCHRLLRPGGKIFVSEMHPMLWMFEPDQGNQHVYSYFDPDTFVENNPLNYYGGEPAERATKYEFQHTIGEIITCVLNAGFALRHFQEHADDISGLFNHFEGQQAQLPLSFRLIGEKSSAAI